jgi:hypothetical protein
MPDYSKQWAEYRRLRRSMWLALPTALLVGVVGALVAYYAHLEQTLLPVTALVSISAGAYWVLRFERFRCPRCSNYFRRTSAKNPNNGLKNCRSCGLGLYESP